MTRPTVLDMDLVVVPRDTGDAPAKSKWVRSKGCGYPCGFDCNGACLTVEEDADAK